MEKTITCKKCGNTWHYKGKRVGPAIYISCPKCHYCNKTKMEEQGGEISAPSPQ